MGTEQESEVVVNNATEEVVENVTPSVEDRAREQGWRPKEEYEGDPDRWVSAEVFVAKGELIERIEAMGKELKTTKKAMQLLQDHHKQVKEAEFKRALEYLKSQKKTAYENGDVDKIIDIDEQIATVKETQKQQAAANEGAVDQSDPHPDFVAWTKRNSWYNNDEELHDIADSIGSTYAAKHKDKSPLEVVEYVEKQVKRMYPEKFQNPNRTKASPVEGASHQSTRKTDTFELTEEERQVMNTFVRSGTMTKEDYIAGLKTIRGL